jgi:hypothetical protein
VRPALVVLALLAGCGDDDFIPPEDLKAPPDMAVDLSGPVNRGPAQFAVPAAVGGLWWDPPTQTLYLSTAKDQLATFSDDGMTHVLATVPQNLAPIPGGLGQLVRLSDGTLAVTEEGAGQFGSVFLVRTDGSVDPVGNLDPTRRRVGLALAENGQLYDTWTVLSSGGTIAAAGVSRVDPVAGETDAVAANLGRPIGVAGANGRLYISDGVLQKIWYTPLATPGTLTVFASPSNPGLIALGRNAGLFAAGPSQVYEIDVGGGVHDAVASSQAVGAVAWDGDHKRLFFVEVGDGDAGTTSTIRIEPLD